MSSFLSKKPVQKLILVDEGWKGFPLYWCWYTAAADGNGKIIPVTYIAGFKTEEKARAWMDRTPEYEEIKNANA